MTINISLIMIIFILTWIPVHIQSIIVYFVNGNSIDENIFAVTVTILHLNSIIHPFIYAYRVKNIRFAVFKMLN